MSEFWRNSPFTLSQSLPFFGCPLFAAGVIGPTGADWSKSFPKVQGPAFVFSDLLQITPGHVQAHRVTPDVLVGFRCRDFVATRADHRNHLGLPVVVARHRRIVHCAALGDQIMSRFGEEERLLAAVPAHLLLVLHIVAADAEDAAHGKAGIRARDGKRGDVPAADDIFHFHDERSSRDHKTSAARPNGRVPTKGGYFLMNCRRKKNGHPKVPFRNKPVAELLPAYGECSSMRLGSSPVSLTQLARRAG